ncbi:MAG TPA: AEC family transporter [Asticcacaulis sp.]|nr:AEC family transporter [Asticcacaulis sp.]
MIDTLSRVLVFFAFIAAGAILVRFKRLDQAGLNGLSAYFYWLGFPAWLLVSFSQLPRFDSHMATALAAYIAAMIACAAIVVTAGLLLRQPKTAAVPAGMASFINNSAFLGIPIAVSLFGPAAATSGPLVVACDFLALFCLGCAALAKASGHTFKEALVHTARNPTLIGALLGLICLFAGIRLPIPVETALEIMGKSGPPVALVALGGMLGLMPARALLRIDTASALAIAAKILLAPALVALVLTLIGVDPLFFKICVLLSATPTAVSVFIQTKMYGTWYEGAATTVAQGTFISLFTLSALALVLTRIA